MFSTSSVRRNFSRLMNKLGLSDSMTSHENIAAVKGSGNIASPRGYIPMYVGEELKRYQVPVKYVSLPMFRELIVQSQGGDLEVKVDGPITLACTTETFDQLLRVAKKSQNAGALLKKNDILVGQNKD